MAWLPAMFKDETWRQTVEKTMGCAQAEESGLLQKRGGMNAPFPSTPKEY